MITRRQILSVFSAIPALGFLKLVKSSEGLTRKEIEFLHPIRTGYREIDLTVGGFFPGQLVVVGANWADDGESIAHYMPLRDMEESLNQDALGKAFAKNFLRRIASYVAFSEKKKVLFATSVVSEDTPKEDFADLFVERLERTNGLMSKQEKIRKKQSYLKNLEQANFPSHVIPASQDSSIQRKFWELLLGEIQSGKYQFIVLDEPVQGVEDWLSQERILFKLKESAMRCRVPVLMPASILQTGTDGHDEYHHGCKQHGDIFINCQTSVRSKLHHNGNPKPKGRFFEWFGEFVSDHCPCEKCEGHNLRLRFIWFYNIDFIHVGYVRPGFNKTTGVSDATKNVS